MIKSKYLVQQSSNKMKKIIFILFFLTLWSSVFADDNIMDLGLEVYNNKAQCGVCHTLQSAGSEGSIGPDLDQTKPSMDRIRYVVTNGLGVMQAWEGILSYEEIEAVSYYVFENANK